VPTHEDPPPKLAPVLLGITEGDRISIALAGGHYITGEVLEDEGGRSGEYFGRTGRHELRLEASGVTFELELRYHEDSEGVSEADSIDLRLVEGHDWFIPITPDIERIHKL